jgi:hypothetical protein
MRLLHSPRLVLALACALAWLAGVSAADRSPAAMAEAATAFLASLTPEQQKLGAFPLTGAERTNWHFVPTEMFNRNGLTIQAMTPAQRKLAHRLLEAALSEGGYLTATAIMDLESVLAVIEGPAGKLRRDPERYFFSVFGTPSPRGAWGFRVEGHHLSIHFSVVNGNTVASTPMFLGANPAEVPSGPSAGLRVLGSKEDSARALVLALDAAQRKQAIINTTAPNDIQTMNALDIKPLDPAGLAAAAMTPAQRALLLQLIESYTSVMETDIAADRMTAIRQAGLEKISFAWAGDTERGRRHYYRVQGPTFLIEFDNTQNDGNHIHSVWRDFQGDFGRDILREHLRGTAH